MTKTKKTKIKYASRYKINKQTKKQTSSQQKTLRIIFHHSPSLENDANIYKTEFIKQGYKVDFKLIDSVNHINKGKNENYYDVNLFLEILPFKCKNMFPSKSNLFMPNNELFIDTTEDNKKKSKYNRYEELKSIDYVLCKTEICNKFFNFIKKEKYRNNIYKYQTLYTKFTSSIDDKIKKIVDRDDYNDTVLDPNLFIHLAGKSGFKNTPDLVHCWIKNKGFLDIDPDIKLVITCYEHCSKWFNLTLKRFFNNYDFEKDPDVSMNRKTNTATYKNMTIYFKPITPFNEYINIITKANVAICISNKEGYGHYINEARYMKKFIITLDYPPMNELVKDKDDKNGNGGNGIILKKKNKFINRTGYYKETKFNFYEAYPDSDELRDSIIWCIKHKHELRKWGKNGRKMFLDDKNYFEDKMKKFIESKL